MSITTAKNENHQVVLAEEYLGKKKAEVLLIEGSDSKIYSDLLKHTPITKAEEVFSMRLWEAIEVGVKPFKVPVCDPSIDEKGVLQFVAGCKPAVGYSYNQLTELANINGVRLGDEHQYALFLATLIRRMLGWSNESAIDAVCNDSKRLGHYCDSRGAKHDFEPTGSRKIASKCDLANTCKILTNRGGAGFWTVGGTYDDSGHHYPIARFILRNNRDYHYRYSVGWFVL